MILNLATLVLKSAKNPTAILSARFLKAMTALPSLTVSLSLRKILLGPIYPGIPFLFSLAESWRKL